MSPLSDLLTALGDIAIGYSVIRVHTKVVHEHKIDAPVIKAMKRETYWVVIGIILIILGFLVEWLPQTALF